MWGQPVPNKGEKGYSPHKHSLEMVHTTASHYKEMSMTLDQALDDIEDVVRLTSLNQQERIHRIERIIEEVRKAALKLNQEYSRELKGLN